MSNAQSYIEASWGRSVAASVDPDCPAPTFVDHIDHESTLQRAARPVLASLTAELANEPVCLILTDPKAVVLHRGGGDHSLLSALDEVHLAPGFRYAESEVGTNGIGTAIEMGAPILVDGNEHFTGSLRQFSCAGALITHPVTGTLMGIVDITTKAKNTNPLMLSFARLAARQIQERVLDEANTLDNALLRGYYAACRHSGGPVLAVSEKVFMMNSLAQQRFDAGDQAALLTQSREAAGREESCTLLADLPSGITARLAYRPTFVGDSLAGGIIRVKEQRALRPFVPGKPYLPGVTGTSPVWEHVTQEIITALSRSEWLVVQGEGGSGKLTLLTAAHKHVRPHRRLVVLDTAEQEDIMERADAELDSGADLVLRHAHLLSSDQRDALTVLLQRTHDNSVAQDPWVALTTQTDEADTDVGIHLLHFFPHTVSVPPLRQHLEDLPALVRLLLNRIGATELVLSQPAMNQLMRLPWPGNVTHLRQVLATIVRTQRSGTVEVHALPAECAATTRRSLSRIESLERDAIVEAIGIHSGDKAAAARSLGMSRATIYRKIRHYGIVT